MSEELTFKSVMLEAVDVERRKAGVAGGLYALLLANRDEWESEVKTAEAWILSSAAGEERMATIPTCWGQAVSDIRGGIKKGLDPDKFPTYSKFKQAKVALGKEAKADDKKADDAKPEANSGERASNDPRNKGDGAKREKDGEPDDSLEEALTGGIVVYADSTEIVPSDMRQTMKYLAVLNEHQRGVTVGKIEQAAKAAHDISGRERREAGKGGGKLKAAK